MRTILFLMLCTVCLSGCAELQEIYAYQTMTPAEWNDRQRQKEAQTAYTNICQSQQGDKTVNTELSLESFLTDLAGRLKAEGNEVAGTPTQNMALQDIAFIALRTKTHELLSILSQYKSFSQDTCYRNLEQQVESMEKMRSELCSNALNYEKQQFIKKTGMTLATDEETVFSVTNPKKGVMYSLQGSTVLQNTKGGVLLRAENAKVRFLYTSFTYPDDERISGFASYAGIYKYITTQGSNKTVYAFREIPTNKYKAIYDKLLFYSDFSDGSCAPVRQPSPAEIKLAFKNPKSDFINEWGREKQERSSGRIAEYNLFSVQDSALRAYAETYSRTVEGPSQMTGILSKINTLFVEQE